MGGVHSIHFDFVFISSLRQVLGLSAGQHDATVMACHLTLDLHLANTLAI